MRKAMTMFVCLLFLASMLGASAVVFAKKPPKPPGGKPDLGTEYQITDNPYGQIKPRMHGNIVIWSDYRSGNDVYMYHLGPDGVPFTDDDGGEYEVAGDPDKVEEAAGVYGNIVLFQRWDSDNPVNRNVYMYHLGEDGIPGTGDDKGEYQLSNCEGSEWGRIYGTIVIWRGQVDGECDSLYGLDLGSNEIPDAGEDPVLLPGTVGNNGIQIYKNEIVYGKSGDIHIYNFGTDINDVTDDTIAHLEKTGTQQWPFLYEDSLVWQDDRNGNWYIYYGEPGPDGEWGTADDVESQITSPRRENDGRPRIYGNTIVWPRDGRKDDIYMHDLTTGETNKVTNSGAAVYTWIFEDHIVYQDARNDNADVFLFILK
jgi:beta propeller repeat protein